MPDTRGIGHLGRHRDAVLNAPGDKAHSTMPEEGVVVTESTKTLALQALRDNEGHVGRALNRVRLQLQKLNVQPLGPEGARSPLAAAPGEVEQRASELLKPGKDSGPPSSAVRAALPSEAITVITATGSTLQMSSTHVMTL